MHRKFIALVISTAIAITGVSVLPARADNNDVAKVLFGIAAIAIIGNAINKANKPAKASTRAYVAPAPAPVVRPLPHSVSRYVLPGQCKRRANTYNGTRTILGAHCVSNNYAYARSLPANCIVNYWNVRRDQINTGYGERCLIRHGYRISAY